MLRRIKSPFTGEKRALSKERSKNPNRLIVVDFHLTQKMMIKYEKRIAALGILMSIY